MRLSLGFLQLEETAEIQAVRKLNDYDIKDCVVPLKSE